jgi:hypothetical protein
MARTLHLFGVVSGLAMMAEGVVGLFYQPGWMVQQNAITIRGFAAAIAFAFAVALLDRAFVWARTLVSQRLHTSAQADAPSADHWPDQASGRDNERLAA